MADTIEIIQGTATTIEIAGLQGPQGPQGATGATGATGAQGPAGTGIETLTTKGDLLYRDTSVAARLPIGTSGQILKVAASGIPEWGAAPASGVTSVNGNTGAVTITAASIDAAEANHSHQPADIYSDAVYVSATTLSGGEPNGVYFRNGSDNGKAIYKSAAGYALYWSDENKWTIGNNAQSAAYFVSSTDSAYPWQATGWIVGPNGSGTAPTVAQATLSQVQLDAAANAVSTRVPKTGNAGSTELVLGSDTRLTNSRDPNSHTHGNLTNDGKIGSTSGLPLKTGTAGVVEAGSFGTSAGTFCAGDDARLSDARTPSSTLAHKASHSTGGTDALAPSDIGAQSLFVSENIVLSANVTLGSSRAKKWRIQNYNGTTYNITLPTTGVQEGDVVVITTGTLVGSQTIREDVGLGSFVTLATISEGQSYRFISVGTSSSSWEIDQVYTHTHAASDITSGTLLHERGGLEADVSAYNGLVKISGGATSAVTVTSAGEALLDDADASAQRTTLGAAASGPITTSGLTQATARILGRTTASTGAVEELSASDVRTFLNVADGATAYTHPNHTGDVTSVGDGATTIANNAVTYAKMQDISATSRILGRKTAAAGDTEECTLSEILDFVGSAAQGDLLIRGASTWTRLAAGTSGHYLKTNGSGNNPEWAAQPVEYVIACSDETTDLTTGTAKVTFRAPVAFLLTAVAASVNTAPTGSTLIVDINNGANSALSTKLSIDASEKTSATAASAAVINTSYDDFAADAEITIDIDQIGSTIAGKGLKVILKGTRA